MLPKFDGKMVFNTAVGMAVGTLIVMPLIAYARSFVKI
tara:strand:- start:513 stop:626 length:114 start_codon:yes stop_codon:yes gene_type:complete